MNKLDNLIQQLETDWNPILKQIENNENKK